MAWRPAQTVYLCIIVTRCVAYKKRIDAQGRLPATIHFPGMFYLFLNVYILFTYLYKKLWLFSFKQYSMHCIFKTSVCVSWQNACFQSFYLRNSNALIQQKKIQTLIQELAALHKGSAGVIVFTIISTYVGTKKKKEYSGEMNGWWHSSKCLPPLRFMHVL